MTLVPLQRGARPAGRVGPDWVLAAATGAILVIGTLLVWSATAHEDQLTHGDSTAYLKKHAVNIVVGLVLGLAVAATDHRLVRIWVPVVYAASVLGLLAVLVAGTTINGSRSWIELGGLSVQPAELAKLAVVVALALVRAERAEALGTLRVRTTDVLLLLGVAGLPALLIIAQPDLGTMLVLTVTVFAVLGVSGVPRRWLVGLAAAGIGTAVLAASSGMLKAYQVNRFLAFTDPTRDPLGAGYNTTQARIAIGNGGLVGQGLFHGSQTRAGFVPEQHTDFVFTVAGEELGLVGAGLLIALLGVVIWRALEIARQSDDQFGRIAAAGIACWFGFQAFQNVGMCLGIMPVTGVPLPLVSYGGSSMFASLMAVGLLQNVRMRQTASRGRPLGRTVIRSADLPSYVPGEGLVGAARPVESTRGSTSAH